MVNSIDGHPGGPREDGDPPPEPSAPEGACGFEPAELTALATEAARSAWERGLTVLRPGGAVVPIPLIAQPAIFSREAFGALAAEARVILSGAVKLAKALLAHGDARDREALLGPFEGLEAEAMSRLFDTAPSPAMMARVDFLPSAEGGPPRALELNATIPAMSGYADLAAHAFIRAAARSRGLPPRRAEELVALCGSNVEKLRAALVRWYEARGGTRARPSIALVARPGDAQIGELRHMAAHFRRMGHEAENLTPEECVPERWDVLYRHVWAHNTPPGSPFARALLAPERFALANPVNGLLEAKALFARLSECAEDGDLTRLAGLGPEELAAARRLPLTRRLDAALAPRLLAERERWVLKRSWDYGGKSVRLGFTSDEAGWRRAVEEALTDERAGGWVAQERVVSQPSMATRVTPEGTSAAPLYRDVSTYAGLGAGSPDGCVVRAASSPIVNVLGGGGLAAVLPEEVCAALAQR